MPIDIVAKRAISPRIVCTIQERSVGGTILQTPCLRLLIRVLFSGQDFRDFFDAEEEESSRQQQPKAHAYMGSLREEGALKYAFDRTSPPGKRSLAAHLGYDKDGNSPNFQLFVVIEQKAGV